MLHQNVTLEIFELVVTFYMMQVNQQYKHFLNQKL